MAISPEQPIALSKPSCDGFICMEPNIANNRVTPINIMTRTLTLLNNFIYL